jgi:DNA-binding MarR family transcriptional regulator
MNDVRWIENDEREAWLAFVSVFLTLPTALDAQLQRDSGMSFYDFLVLFNLAQSPDESLRMRDLANVTRGSPSRLSQVTTRLESRGWVERRSDLTDGRCTLAVLTPAGRTSFEAAAPRHAERVRKLALNPLSPSQLQLMKEICERQLSAVQPTWLTSAPALVAPAEDTQRPDLPQRQAISTPNHDPTKKEPSMTHSARWRRRSDRPTTNSPQHLINQTRIPS